MDVIADAIAALAPLPEGPVKSSLAAFAEALATGLRAETARLEALTSGRTAPKA